MPTDRHISGPENWRSTTSSFPIFFRRSCRSTLAIISVQTSRSTVYY